MRRGFWAAVRRHNVRCCRVSAAAEAASAMDARLLLLDQPRACGTWQARLRPSAGSPKVCEPSLRFLLMRSPEQGGV